MAAATPKTPSDAQPTSENITYEATLNAAAMGSDGFEKVLIGTRGARETFLDGRKGRAAKNSVLTSGAKQLKCCVTRTVKI